MKLIILLCVLAAIAHTAPSPLCDEAQQVVEQGLATLLPGVLNGGSKLHKFEQAKLKPIWDALEILIGSLAGMAAAPLIAAGALGTSMN